MDGEDMRRISIKGVLIGGLTDLISSVTLGTLTAVVLILVFHLLGMPKAEMQKAIADAGHQQGLLWNAELAVGLGCSVLGGFVSAWLAKHDELLNGFLSSFLCVSLGVLQMAIGRGFHPFALQGVLLVASLVLSLFGGYLRARIKPWNRKSTESYQL
jgi:hypothetical protein